MIRMTATFSEGGQLIAIGLEEENLRRMIEGNPAIVSGESVGLERCLWMFLAADDESSLSERIDRAFHDVIEKIFVPVPSFAEITVACARWCSFYHSPLSVCGVVINIMAFLPHQIELLRSGGLAIVNCHDVTGENLPSSSPTSGRPVVAGDYRLMAFYCKDRAECEQMLRDSGLIGPETIIRKE